MKIRACIFDIGGTLVKTDVALLKAIEMALEANGVNAPSNDVLVASFGTGNYNNIRSAVTAAYHGENADDVVEKCFQTFQRIYPDDFLDVFCLFPNVQSTLIKLVTLKVKLAVQTGFTSREAKLILNQLNLLGFFQAVITIDDVRIPRPAPDALFVTMDRLGVARNECLYVGDTIADIRFAKNAGVVGVCVTTGVQDRALLAAEQPDYMLHDIAEITTLLGNANVT
jgi:phosphoglycolate phosphatase-like HAD superfamily hydrolase